MKYYILSNFTRLLLGALRKYHNNEDKLLVFSNDFIGEEVFAYGVYEKNEIHTLINALDFNSSQHLILDIGANIGNHTVQFAKHFQAVLCFEPNELIYSVLKINTRNLKNVVHYNIGLSDGDREGFLQIPDNNFGGAFVSQTPRKENIAITLKKGDDLRIKDFSVIKIDIEGHEVMAIKGLELAISKNKPIICFELIKRNKSDLEIIDLLKEMGYSRFYIPYNKSLFSKKLKKSFMASFIDGLLFKTKHQLKEINTFDAPFFNMVICEHPFSNYRIKSEVVKK